MNNETINKNQDMANEAKPQSPTDLQTLENSTEILTKNIITTKGRMQKLAEKLQIDISKGIEEEDMEKPQRNRIQSINARVNQAEKLIIDISGIISDIEKVL